MLIFSARAGSLPELIPVVKESLTDKTVNTYAYPSDYYTHTHILLLEHSYFAELLFIL